MTDRQQLQALEAKVTADVFNVNDGPTFITEYNLKELDRLRAVVGEDWDAINKRWVPSRA